jgi:hypothetical protein
MDIPTIDQTLAAAGVDTSTPEGTALLGLLVMREDAVAFSLRGYAGQFGLFPWIVDQVLANEVPLGTPLPPEAREAIHRTFITNMQELQRQQEEGQS